VIKDTTYLYLLAAALLPLCFLWVPARKKVSRDNVPWYDIALAALAFLIPLYFVWKEWEVLTMGWAMGAPTVPFIFSVVLWLMMLEVGRRAGGPVLGIVVFFFSVYPLFASSMPGPFWATSFSFNHVASFHAMGEDSLMGLLFHTFGRLIFGFMAYAVVLQGLGTGKLFNDLASALIRNTRASVAKIAIVSSGLFGSISGSPVANVMVTGAFTIPAMKKEGFPAQFAAAIETVASTGGSLMPPIMGAVAFVMAEFLAIPYAEVCLVAVVPSVLYYICMFAQIDAFAARTGLKPTQRDVAVQAVWQILLKNFHIIVSVFVLLFFLFVLRMSYQGPWIASLVGIILGLFRKETRLTLSGFANLVRDIGRTTGDLLGIFAPIGMIVGSLILTGVAYSLPNEIVELSGGNVVLLLLMGTFAAFILGMGISMVGTYIFLAIVLAPALIQAGFDVMATHLFILYGGLMSAITPPVAVAAYVAASVANSDPMRTGFQAMRLGIALYILPFVFLLNPALIFRGTASEILRVIPTASIALVIISAALGGYFWRIGRLTIITRILLVGAGLLMALPGMRSDLYGIGVFAVVFGLAYFLRGRGPLAKVLVQ
jgi:TRAP transporter 4TM/12TM fusion protein